MSIENKALSNEKLKGQNIVDQDKSTPPLYIGNYLKSFNLSLNVSLRTWISVTYISFILWAGISYYYAINPTEVIVNIARQINVFLMFLFMSVFFHKVKSKSILISSFILIILSVEKLPEE